MFGHDNQTDQNQDNGTTPVISPAPDELLQDTPAPAASSTPAFDTSSISLPSDDAAVDEPAASLAPAPVSTDETSAPTVTPSAPSKDEDHLLTPGHDDDLLHIKQNALQQLSPLVDHLEQTPEEKFRTTMMMIQASDDQSLVPAAYDAAKAITDDKIRAQALLDIINEINYFTQQQQG